MLQRENLGKHICWVGYSNGEKCVFITTDFDLTLVEIPINTEKTIGVQLVDEKGKCYSESIRVQ